MILLTFPLHCSHRMQPLDVGVFGLFKSGLKIALEDWIATHPSQRIRTENIAPLPHYPYLMKFNPSYITSAFQATAIYL